MFFGSLPSRNTSQNVVVKEDTSRPGEEADQYHNNQDITNQNEVEDNAEATSQHHSKGEHHLESKTSVADTGGRWERQQRKNDQVLDDRRFLCCQCSKRRFCIGFVIALVSSICIIAIFVRVAFKGFFSPRCVKPRRSIASLNSLDQCIHDIHDIYEMAGMTVSIVHYDESENETITWHQNYGYANIESRNQVTSNTPFLLSSVSKTFIATAIMQQVEAGALDLDEDINTYLISAFTVANPTSSGEAKITLRHLSTHTSGIIDSDAYYDETYTPGDPEQSLGEFLRSYLTPGGELYSKSNNFLECKPGECTHEYSNAGSSLAAYILEIRLGIPYAQYVEENILAPLGMNNSHFYLANYTDPNVIAMPYEKGRGGNLEAYGYYGYPGYPEGRLFASASDLSKFLAFYSSGSLDETIMSRATKAKTLEAQRIEDDQSFVDRLLFGRRVEQAIFWTKINGIAHGHAGGDMGSFTLMYYEPKKKVGILILTNYAEDNASIALIQIVKQVTKQSDRVANMLRKL